MEPKPMQKKIAETLQKSLLAAQGFKYSEAFFKHYQANQKTKVALLGGSFNPITNTHIDVSSFLT